MPRYSFLLLAGLLAGTGAESQTLRLRPAVGPTPMQADVGDTVQIDLWADLDSVAVSGLDAHLSLPEGLTLLDQFPDNPGLQPFEHGELFARGQVPVNGLDDNVGDTSPDRQHVRFAIVMGVGVDRRVTGEGRVASLRVVVDEPMERAQLRIEDSPILETRLVLPDGTTELRFQTRTDLELTAVSPTAVAAGSWGQVKAAR